MENQPITQPVSQKKFPASAAVLIAVVLTAIIAGGGVYFWQNMQLEESEITTPEVTPVQTAIVKPTVASPLNGTTIENPLEGIKIIGKAAPNSFVWLFSVSEMDPDCLNLSLALTLGDRADANGNFEIDYTPDGEAESWPSEFAVVSLDETRKYQLKWLESMFCAPDEAKSDYFQLNLKSTAAAQPETYTNLAYGFSLTFPASWGEIKEQIVADAGIPKIVRAIRLSSETDEARHVQINIFNLVDKTDPYVIDAPQTFIKENNQYAFYDYSPECPICDPVIQNEARQIIQTFTLK
jgi:hypothetical protein